MEIVSRPVKNFDKGRFGHKPIAIVLHIAQGKMSSAFNHFNNSSSKASSHYIIGKNGTIWQFVGEENTAWTNGRVKNPSWKLLDKNVNPNFYTISIEHEGYTGEPWTQKMYDADVWLISRIVKKWSIPVDRFHIIGHFEIDSVDRRSCPGKGLDFNKLINLVKNNIEEEDPQMIKELQEKVNSLESEIARLRKELQETKQELEYFRKKYNEVKDGGSGSNPITDFFDKIFRR